MSLDNYGITDNGFTRPTLSDIVEDVKSQFRETFGSKLLTTDDSVAGQIATIIAEREDMLWKLMEATYASQTLSGAEGIYLNDVLGKYGIFRRDAQTSSGTIYIETDSTCPNNTIISKTTQYSGNNGKTYRSSDDIRVSQSVGGMSISKEQVNSGFHKFVMDNPYSGQTAIFEYNVTLLSDGVTVNEESIPLMFDSLIGFIESNSNGIYSGYCWRDSNDSLLIGFDSSYNFIGLPKNTEMYFLNPIGNRYTAIPVEADEAGETRLGVDGITSILPQPIGYVDIHNPSPFYSGADVESDGAYRLRHSLTKSKTGKGTTSNLINTLSILDGVEDVIVFENPTPDENFNYAEPFSAMFVVLGGNAPDIVSTLYNNKPVNVHFKGSYTESVPTLDGKYETVGFTPAVERQLTVKIRYKTRNNLPISTSEKNDIIDAVESSIRSFTIGDTIYVPQVVSAALSAVSSSRVKEMSAQIKRASSGDETFVDTSFQLDYYESAYVTGADIILIQEL